MRARRHRKKGKRKKNKRILRDRLIYGFLAVTVLLICFLAYFLLNPSNQTPTDQTSQLKAVIIDQLSITQPNQTFWQTAKVILKNAGFSVYYYEGIAVDVNFYRNLPSRGFNLIIFRVHSAISEQSEGLIFFTSERFDDDKARTTYLLDVLNDRLVRARVDVDTPAYFGITPQFVKDSNGRFDSTVIIMMGCDGLRLGYTGMAKAFIDKGAKVYIGWNGPVSAPHTDQATIRLLQCLIQKQTIKNAVTDTNSEVGPDPTGESTLSWYPAEVENYAILNIADII